MQIVDIEHANIAKKTALALGYFDTFHLGHQMLLSAVSASGYVPAMFTFEGDFYGALGLETLPIYTWESRMHYAEKYGVRYVVSMRADRAHLGLSPKAFFALLMRANPALIVCGEDFRFGKNAVAGIEELQSYCAAHGVAFRAFPLLKDHGGLKIGTFGIRKALEAGDMQKVSAYLGRTYTLVGTVTHGRADGAKLGFPTANFPLNPYCQTPAMGVYLAGVYVIDRWYLAVCNVGTHPTLGDMSVNVECYLLHYQGDLYGQEIKVRLHARLRDIRTFATKEELAAQIEKDCQEAERMMGGVYD